MNLVGNSLNGKWHRALVDEADCDALEQIDLAVAYALEMETIFDLASKRRVPLRLYTLMTGDGFPSLDIARKFVEGTSASTRLFLTKDFFHPKVMWFRGVGAYIGSANLTDKAWNRNHEIGVWMAQEDLDRLGWVEQLASMFQAIAEHCREAKLEDLQTLEQLKLMRREFDEAKSAFQRKVNQALADIPGGRSRVEVSAGRKEGGAALRAFSSQWGQGLTILRKIEAYFAANRVSWPTWVDRDAEPSIVQDQATEWWWDRRFRQTRDSMRAMADAHERNRANPDEALADLFAAWKDFVPADDEPNWSFYANDSPRELKWLLSASSLRSSGQEELTRILTLCHAAREHGRQITSEDLGLGPKVTTERHERIRRWAFLLEAQRSRNGRSIWEVLEFVIWGDMAPGGTRDAAERLWAGAHEAEWKLPHIGVYILGEMIGYARPAEYPPRNNRVSKTLFALGFDGITYS